MHTHTHTHTHTPVRAGERKKMCLNSAIGRGQWKNLTLVVGVNVIKTYLYFSEAVSVIKCILDPCSSIITATYFPDHYWEV